MPQHIEPYFGWPRHVYLFVCVRDGGGVEKTAAAVAQLHDISIEQLKAECKRAGDEYIAEHGPLQQPELRVYQWACS